VQIGVDPRRKETLSIPGFFFKTGDLLPNLAVPETGHCIDLDAGRNPFSQKKTGFTVNRRRRRYWFLSHC